MRKVGNVFANPDNAEAAVYSALRRSKNLIRVEPGLYRLVSQSEGAIKHDRRKLTSKGLAEAVQRLKAENPALSNTEIKDRLLATGFDFKGKNPSSAVNIVVGRLKIGLVNSHAQEDPPRLFEAS